MASMTVWARSSRKYSGETSTVSAIRRMWSALRCFPERPRRAFEKKEGSSPTRSATFCRDSRDCGSRRRTSAMASSRASRNDFRLRTGAMPRYSTPLSRVRCMRDSCRAVRTSPWSSARRPVSAPANKATRLRPRFGARRRVRACRWGPCRGMARQDRILRPDQAPALRPQPLAAEGAVEFRAAISELCIDGELAEVKRHR